MATKTTSQLLAVATGNITGGVLWGDDSAGATKKFAVSKVATADTIVARDNTGGITVVSVLISGSVVTSQNTLNFIGGAVDTKFKNSANNQDNLTITDAGNVTVRGTMKATGGLDFSSATFPLTNVSTQATVGANGGATAHPANPVGYIKVTLNGSGPYIIPYYNG